MLYAINALVFGVISVAGLRYRHDGELDAVGETTLAVTIALTVFNVAAVWS